MPGSRAQSRAADTEPFSDRLAALVEERRSQVCLGLDPVPGESPWAGSRLAQVVSDDGAPGARESAAAAVLDGCLELIERAGPSCVAIKPQLARFEQLGGLGWLTLESVVAAAKEAGLLVIADGKRGDVPVSAEAYGAAMVGTTETPWGPVPGLGADAFTANPLIGADSLEPLVAAAADAGAGVFFLVRTSNPGAADFFDGDAGGRPLHERIAEQVAALADRLGGTGALSGAGAVVGGTEPGFIGRLRELMPRAVMLIPGIGAQGGRAEDVGPAFAPGAAAALVTASRSIATAGDPAAAAEELRETVWAASGHGS